MFRYVFYGAILILAVGMVLGGIILLGNLAQDELQRHADRRIPFAKIQCPSPPGMKQVDFLDEVQYVSSMPAELKLGDQELPDRLTRAFGKHPWVERVGQVQIIDRAQLHVDLVFRKPVLAVLWKGTLRVIDGNGVLLPAGASPAGLTVYRGKPSPPNAAAGEAWSDPNVVAAAKKAAEAIVQGKVIGDN